MLVAPKRPTPKRKINSDRFHYRTRVTIYYRKIPVGVIRARSNEYDIIEITDKKCNEHVNTLNSSKLNNLPEFTYDEVTFSINEGYCSSSFICVCKGEVCTYTFF